MMAAKGATYPVLSADARAGRGVRSGRLSAGRVGLLHRRERQHAVVPVQRLDADPLLQQGPVPRGRARSRNAAAHLAGGRGGGARSCSPRACRAASPPRGRPGSMSRTCSAVHDQPISTKQNGFGGLDTELVIANDVAVKHLAALAEWQKTKIFDYGGRADRADAKFHGSQCGMYVSSSATRPDILANAKFEVGYGLMPYWPDVAGAPQNAIIGGATLWVLKARPVGEYKGVARFFAYLSRPEVQARWHQASGYLPITRAAYELTRAAGLLREESRHRHLDQADHAQGTDAEHQGAAARLVRAGARGDRGRAGAGDHRQGCARRRRSIPQCGAATRSCAGSRRRTRSGSRRPARRSRRGETDLSSHFSLALQCATRVMGASPPIV